MIEQTQVTQPAAAPSMAEFKAAETARLKGDTSAAQPVETQVAQEPPAKPEVVADTGAAKEPIQDVQHQKRDKTAAGRAKELIAEGRLDEAQAILDGAAKRDRERADRAEQELRELRGRTTEPVKSAAEPAKPENKQEAKARKDFLAEYFKANPAAAYEDGLDAFDEIRETQLFEKWDKRSDERRQKDNEAETARKNAEKQHGLMAKVKEKYPDADEVFAQGAKDAADVPPNAGIGAAFAESDIPGDLRYHLCKNVDEFRRISALSPQAAYRAIVALEVKLSSEPAMAAPTPEKPRIPPSQSAAPPTTIGGAGGSAPVSPLRPGLSMSEFKKAEAARLAKKG